MTTRREFLAICAAASLSPDDPAARLAAELRRRPARWLPFDWKSVTPIRKEIAGAHPRFFRDAALWKLRAEAAPHTLWRPRERKPYTAEKPRPGGNSGGAGYVLIELAAAWLATGDDFYLEQAAPAMRTVCEYVHWGGVNGKPKDTDLHAGELLFGLGVAYDTFYHVLSAADRAKVAGKLGLQAHLMYEHHRQRPTIPWEQNHTYIDLGGLWVTAAALSGEVSKADKWYALGSRALKTAVYLLDGGDGAFYEGIGYWQFGFAQHLLPQLDLYRTVTGEDPFTAFSAFRNLKYYLMHTLLPGGRYSLNLGDVDGGATAHARIGSARMAMLGAAAAYNDPECQFLAGYLASLPGTRAASDPWTLCFWDPSVASSDPRTRWEPARHFEDLSLVTARTSWRDDATHFAMRCGPALGHRATRILLSGEIKEWKPSTGHVHPDLNALLLFDHAEHFVVDTGYTWDKRTRDHATVLVDGAGQIGDGQRWPGYDPWNRLGRIGVFLGLAGQYCYVRGEAANGYEAALELQRFDRHVTMMADAQTAYLLIHDVLESKQPHRYEWLLALLSKAEQLGTGVFGVTQGKRALTLYLLEPANVEAVQEPLKVLQRDEGGRTAQLGYRLSVALAGSRVAQYTAVLLLHAAGEPAVKASIERSAVRVSSREWNNWLAPQGAAGPISTDGSNAAARVVAGQVVRWAVHDATRLSFDGGALCTASSPVSVVAGGARAVVEARQAAEVRIAAGRASACRLNDQPAACTVENGLMRLRVSPGRHRLVLT